MAKRVRKRIKYKNPVVLAEMINGYFDECDALEVPYTVSGLCLSTGYSRSLFLRSDGDTELEDVITQARQIIEQQLETMLYTGTRTTGVIFALKNFGWVDRKEVDIGSSDGSETTYTIEVVKPDGNKVDLINEIPDPRKVVPFRKEKEAV